MRSLSPQIFYIIDCR